MNSNNRLQLASILNKDDIKKPRESFKEKNQTQRFFGRELTNHSAVFNNNKKPLSKSINPIKDQPQLPQIKIHKESFNVGRKSLVLQSLNTSSDNRLPDHIQNVNEYSDVIYEFLLKKQERNSLQDNYMKNQKQISEKMRTTLIDWLVDVHLKFRLLPETLFKTVMIIDKYLQNNEISKKKLQLLGITALFISCKYEQIYPPNPRSFVQLSQKSYSFSQIVEMQGKILKDCDFNLTFTSSINFLERYVRMHKLTQKQSNLCRYLLELSFLEIQMQKYNPSTIAAASIFLMTYISKTNTKLDYSEIQMNQNEIKMCAKDLCLILQNIPKGSAQASRKKYSHLSYGQVSKILLQQNNEI